MSCSDSQSDANDRGREPFSAIRKSDLLVGISLFLIRKSDSLRAFRFSWSGKARKSDFLVSVSLFLVRKSDFFVAGEQGRLRSRRPVTNAVSIPTTSLPKSPARSWCASLSLVPTELLVKPAGCPPKTLEFSCRPPRKIVPSPRKFTEDPLD